MTSPTTASHHPCLPVLNGQLFSPALFHGKQVSYKLTTVNVYKIIFKIIYVLN